MAIRSTFAKNQRTRSIVDGPATQRERDRIEAGRQFMAEDKLFADFPSRTAYDQALYDRTQSIASARSASTNNTPPPTASAEPIVIPESAFSGANAAADRRFDAPLFNNPQQPLATPARTPFSMSQQQPFGNAQLPYNSLFPLGSSPDVGSSGFSREIKPSTPFAPAGPTINTTQQILSPSGFASTNLTPQQVEQRAQARQQAEQMGTMPRTPQQQQELLAQMRTRGATIREGIASNARDSFGTKTPAQTYTTPSGSSIVAPTNMFGRPIQSFSDVYAARSPINEAALARMGRGSSAPTNSGILASTGFGAMQREQNEMMPPPIRSQSLFGNMGYASTFGGDPQPASPMLAGNSMVGRTRKRLFGTI
jgi:hypothetical protein